MYSEKNIDESTYKVVGTFTVFPYEHSDICLEELLTLKISFERSQTLNVTISKKTTRFRDYYVIRE